jgi:hypothetical protein
MISLSIWRLEAFIASNWSYFESLHFLNLRNWYRLFFFFFIKNQVFKKFDIERINQQRHNSFFTLRYFLLIYV